MKRLAVILAALVAMAVPAQAVPETAEGLAAAMQGCWNQGDGVPGSSLQICLDGDVEGALSMLGCYTNDKVDLTECWTEEGRYAFGDEKFWRNLGGPWNNCDILLDSSDRFTLRNCVWIDAAPDLGPIEDAIYERAMGQ